MNSVKATPLPSTPFYSRTPSPSINYSESVHHLKSSSPSVTSPSPSLSKSNSISGISRLLSPDTSSPTVSPSFSRVSSPHRSDKTNLSNVFSNSTVLSQSPTIKIPKPVQAHGGINCDPFGSFSYHNNSDYNLSYAAPGATGEYCNLSDEDTPGEGEILYANADEETPLSYLRDQRQRRKYNINTNGVEETLVNNYYSVNEPAADNFYGSYHDSEEITDEEGLRRNLSSTGEHLSHIGDNSSSLSSVEDQRLLRLVLNKGPSSTNSLNEDHYRPSINFSEDRTSVECEASLPSSDSMNSLNEAEGDLKKRPLIFQDYTLVDSSTQGILLNQNSFHYESQGSLTDSTLPTQDTVETLPIEDSVGRLPTPGAVIYEDPDEDEQEIVFVDEMEHEMALRQNSTRRKYTSHDETYDNNSTIPVINLPNSSSDSFYGLNPQEPLALSSSDSFDDLKNQTVEVLYIGSEESLNFYNPEANAEINPETNPEANAEGNAKATKSGDVYDSIYSRKLSYVSSSDEEYLINNSDRGSIILNEPMLTQPKGQDGKFNFFDSDSEEDYDVDDYYYENRKNPRHDTSGNTSPRSSLVLSLGGSDCDSDVETVFPDGSNLSEKPMNSPQRPPSLNLSIDVDDYGAKMVQVSDSDDEAEEKSSKSRLASSNSLYSLKLEVSDDDTVSFNLSCSNTPTLESSHSFSKGSSSSSVSTPLSISSNTSSNISTTSNAITSNPSPPSFIALVPQSSSSNNMNLNIDISAETNSDFLPPKSSSRSTRKPLTISTDSFEPSIAPKLDIFSPTTQSGLPPTSPSNLKPKITPSHSNLPLSTTPSTSASTSRVFTFEEIPDQEHPRLSPSPSTNPIPQSPVTYVDKKMNKFSSPPPSNTSSRSSSSASASSLNSPRWSISRMFNDWYVNSPLTSPSAKSRAERSYSVPNSTPNTEYDPIPILASQVHSPLDDSTEVTHPTTSEFSSFKLPLTSSPSVLFASKEKKLNQFRRR